jgi:hypothetical protein
MNKIQKALSSTLGFSILLLVFIVALFIILSPKVSSLLFPLKRQAILNEFINKTKSEGKISPQVYWQFREFYSPGYFTFSRTGIAGALIDKSTKEIGIKYNKNAVDLIDLAFASQKINSLDMLTKQSSLDSIIDKAQFKKEKIIFINQNSLIYQKDAKTVQIVFLLANGDIKKANGFFDYTDKDKKITDGENWFNITSFVEN